VSQRSEMRRQVRAALAEIDDLIPVPWDMRLLVERVGQRRLRPIQLLPVPIRSAGRELSGASWAEPGADIICYDQTASPAVRDQTIGHELGHLLMHHQQIRTEGDPLALTLLSTTNISPALIQNFFGRTAYDDDAEAAAEEFGTRLVQTGRRRRGAADIDPLGRLTETLR
jgi:hypothetical protein